MRATLLSILLVLALSGCLRTAEPEVDRTGTPYRRELAFDGSAGALNHGFDVPRGPTELHVLVEGRNAAGAGSDVRVTLLDPQGAPSGSCVCGKEESIGSFASGARPGGAEGRWTLSFEPTGPTRIRVTVTTT